MRTSTLLLALGIAAGIGTAGECRDKTGMKWVLPFKQAHAAAKERGRLLMIKPIAFGTTPDGGW